MRRNYLGLFRRDDVLNAPTLSSWNDFGHFRPKHSRDDIVSQSTMSSRQNYNHTIFLTAFSQSLALSVSNMVCRDNRWNSL